MNQLRQKDRLLEVKIWPILKVLKKLKKYQKGSGCTIWIFLQSILDFFK